MDHCLAGGAPCSLPTWKLSLLNSVAFLQVPSRVSGAKMAVNAWQGHGDAAALASVPPPAAVPALSGPSLDPPVLWVSLQHHLLPFAPPREASSFWRHVAALPLVLCLVQQLLSENESQRQRCHHSPQPLVHSGEYSWAWRLRVFLYLLFVDLLHTHLEDFQPLVCSVPSSTAAFPTGFWVLLLPHGLQFAQDLDDLRKAQDLQVLPVDLLKTIIHIAVTCGLGPFPRVLFASWPWASNASSQAPPWDPFLLCPDLWSLSALLIDSSQDAPLLRALLPASQVPPGCLGWCQLLRVWTCCSWLYLQRNLPGSLAIGTFQDLTVSFLKWEETNLSLYSKYVLWSLFNFTYKINWK